MQILFDKTSVNLIFSFFETAIGNVVPVLQITHLYAERQVYMGC